MKLFKLTTIFFSSLLVCLLSSSSYAKNNEKIEAPEDHLFTMSEFESSLDMDSRMLSSYLGKKIFESPHNSTDLQDLGKYLNERWDVFKKYHIYMDTDKQVYAYKTLIKNKLAPSQRNPELAQAYINSAYKYSFTLRTGFAIALDFYRESDLAYRYYTFKILEKLLKEVDYAAKFDDFDQVYSCLLDNADDDYNELSELTRKCDSSKKYVGAIGDKIILSDDFKSDLIILGNYMRRVNDGVIKKTNDLMPRLKNDFEYVKADINILKTTLSENQMEGSFIYVIDKYKTLMKQAEDVEKDWEEYCNKLKDPNSTMGKLKNLYKSNYKFAKYIRNDDHYATEVLKALDHVTQVYNQNAK